MDKNPSLDSIHRLSAELGTSYAQHLNYFEMPANLESDLQNFLQNRKSFKADYLKAVEEKLVLHEFEKKSEEWLTMKVAETQLLDSKDILKETIGLCSRTDRVKEAVDLAVDALDTWKEKMEILDQKIYKLEEKYKELSAASDTSMELMHESVTAASARAISDVLASIRSQREIMQGRVNRMEATLSHYEQLSTSQLKIAAARRNELAQMEEKLKELEAFSGLTCRVKDSTSIDIEFVTDERSQTSSEGCKYSARPDDSHLVVTATFRENEQSFLELENVKTSQMQEEAEVLIKDARLDKDLPKLITGLRKMWMTYVPLITEISQIRNRHAIDWIKEKHQLLLMPRKSNSVVCALKVPPRYPLCGEIVLETVLGQTSHIDPENIRPPYNVSLTGWVMHLESLFGQP